MCYSVLLEVRSPRDLGLGSPHNRVGKRVDAVQLSPGFGPAPSYYLVASSPSGF